MSKRLTRRGFLRRGIKGTLVALAGPSQFSAISVGSIWDEVEKAGSTTGESSVLSNPHREVLHAAADEIISAGDGRPAASQVGAVNYIEAVLRKVPALEKKVDAALTQIEAITKSRFQRPFDKLSSAQRVKVLQNFEKRSARSGHAEALHRFAESTNLFATLRDLVYEAYYTNPKVWPWLDYKFYATSHAGPVMKPFDEAILAQIRKRPKYYREVK